MLVRLLHGSCFLPLLAALVLARPAAAQEAPVEAPAADEEGLAAVVGRGDSLPAARARFEVHLGWRALQQGLPDRAAASFEKVTADSPWHPGAWYLLSRARYAQNRLGDALEAARRAVNAWEALPPARAAAFDPATFHYQLGLCLSATARPAQAVEALAEAARLRPGSWRTHGQLGEILLELGRDEQAADQLRLATELRPEHARGWLAYGRALSRLERHEEAEAALERSLSLDPTSPDAHYALASVHRATGDFDAQEKALERFEELRGPREEARLARQEIDAQLRSTATLLLDGDCAAAKPVLEEVLAHPHVQATGFRQGRIYNDLARCRALAGDDESARRLYRKALKTNPRSFTALFELGTLLASGGEVELGMPLLLDAAAINPFDYSVHVNLALGYGLLGRLNDAVGEVRRAAALQPEDLRVRQLLVDFEWAAGNQAQARAVVARLGGATLPGAGEAVQQDEEWAR